jgi:hypothetical protein
MPPENLLALTGFHSFPEMPYHKQSLSPEVRVKPSAISLVENGHERILHKSLGLQNALPTRLSAPQGSVVHLGVSSREMEVEGREGWGGQEKKRALIQGTRLSPLQTRLR